MKFKKSFRPLELVTTAILRLQEKKGSSFQDIVRFLLVGKKNSDVDLIRLQVLTGLRKGMSFGLISYENGLYRLNDYFKSTIEAQKIKYENRGKKLKFLNKKRNTLKRFGWKKKKFSTLSVLKKNKKLKNKKLRMLALKRNRPGRRRIYRKYNKFEKLIN